MSLVWKYSLPLSNLSSSRSIAFLGNHGNLHPGTGEFGSCQLRQNNAKLAVRCGVIGARRKVVIVGAGVGGLAVGGKLAREGFDVQILEKNAQAGGRTQSMYAVLGGQETFRFDIGPSLLLLPQKYQDAFTAMGEKLEDYIELKKVDPGYRVFFGDHRGPQSLDLMYDVQKMCSQLEHVERGAGGPFCVFCPMRNRLLTGHHALNYYSCQGTEAFIERDFRTFWDYANIPRLLPLLKHLSPFELLGQHSAQMGHYFKDPKLQALFTFQDLYVGLTPYNAPGVFSLLAATEITDGVWYPLGGFGKVRDGLAEAAQKVGAKIQTNSPVKRIDHANGRITGVTLENGRSLKADIVVANADLPYVYNHLLNSEGSKNAQRLTPIEVQPNFYVHAPSRTDPSASPSGTDAITVLLPVAHLGEGYNKGKADNDRAIVDVARTRVFKTFINAGLGDISSNVLSEEVFTPPIWRDTYNLQHGAAFGLSHNLLQLAYFRPDVADASITGLYFVGASTRPGNGVPLVLMGAKLTSNRILEDFN